jgi:hypothetical protein
MIRQAILASFVATTGLSPLALAQSTASATADSCSACASTFTDPSVSPFSDRASILGVAPYHVVEYNGKRSTKYLAGAVIQFRAVPGLTAELLQQSMNQHQAFMASTGQGMSECPLALPGVSATADSQGNSFSVTLASKDSKVAQEVLRRAEALVVAH